MRYCFITHCTGVKTHEQLVLFAAAVNIAFFPQEAGVTRAPRAIR